MDNPWKPIDTKTKLTSYDGPMIILLLKYMPVCCSPRLDADCEDIVFDKIAEWSKKRTETSCYGNSELLLHKKMWDVLNRDKEGLRKEHSFVDWCRRSARVGAEGAATEHANDDTRFQKLAKDIFAHDFTAEQEEPNILHSRRQIHHDETAQLCQQYLAKKLGRRPGRFLHT